MENAIKQLNPPHAPNFDMFSGGQNYPYIRLGTGIKYFLTNLNNNYHVNFSDVSPGIFGINRFTGHSWKNRNFASWSVGKHSLVCWEAAKYCSPTAEDFHILALIHDLTEGVMGDVSSPLKSLLPEYKNLYVIHENWMAKQFGFPAWDEKLEQNVKTIDTIVGDVEGEMFVEAWEPLLNLSPTALEVRKEVQKQIVKYQHYTVEQALEKFNNIYFEYRYGKL